MSAEKHPGDRPSFLPFGVWFEAYKVALPNASVDPESAARYAAEVADKTVVEIIYRPWLFFEHDEMAQRALYEDLSDQDWNPLEHSLPPKENG